MNASVVFGFVAVLLLAAGARRAGAQMPTPAAVDTVVVVRVEGNATVDGDLVIRGFGVTPGSKYSVDAVRRGIRRLHDLGFFSDIAVAGELTPGGVILILRVVENPRVGTVEFSGQDNVGEKDLLEAAGTLVGRMADDQLLSRLTRTLDHLYREKGYTRARIHPRYLPGASETRRTLLVEIEEGPKVRVEMITFVGASRLQPGQLREPMKQGTIGFLKGGVYKPEVVREDVARIEGALAKHGFRDGKVLGYEVKDGSKNDRVVLEFKVQEGPRYRVGTVRWEGNEVVPALALYGITSVTPGGVFNQEKVDKSVEAAYEIYSNQGYLYLSVQPDFTARDSTLDVTFRVQEGKPSHVRDILITGNTRTKERVIRRQLALRPGDLFQRNLLVRSQRELQQLGFFSDMKVDSRPVPNSSDIDLVLNMEERQVGTASAGFGYSSAVGLSGFVELGHTNLFGNGQSVNLRLERGSQRNNAEISFTEPWFRGTPTTVGMDFFTTNRTYRGQDQALDVELQRLGGSLRVGRVLPIPYTRGYATYSLERQEALDQKAAVQIIVNPTTGSTINRYATGLRLTQETATTSSLTLSLVRNSTDHAFYPTVGSLARLRTEISGVPLGGDYTYQKYELDWAQYQRVPLGRRFRPVVMVRSRLGALGELFRDESIYTKTYGQTALPPGATSGTFSWGGHEVPIPVPRFTVSLPGETRELFLLGGTSGNPLRGYDDYEIAPDRNVLRRYVVDQIVDSTRTDTTYATGATFVVYPGGKYMMSLSTEMQFPIADPLHGLLFFDVGGTWNSLGDFRWDSLHRGVGAGLRMEIPLLGFIGFDYGYGFDRLDRRTGRYTRAAWQPHIQFGKQF